MTESSSAQINPLFLCLFSVWLKVHFIIAALQSIKQMTELYSYTYLSTHTCTHTYFQLFQCPVSCMCWVSVLWRRPSAPSYLLLLSPVVLYPSGGLPPPCQSRHQLESYALDFSLLSGTHYVIFI